MKRMTHKERMETLSIHLDMTRRHRLEKLLRAFPRNLRHVPMFGRCSKQDSLVEVVANLNARLKRLETLLKFKEEA